MFKIVQRGPKGTLWSYNPSISTGRRKNAVLVRYWPGRVTHPKAAGTPLYAFESVQAAKNFCLCLDIMSRYELWEAEATGARGPHVANYKTGLYILNGPGRASAEELQKRWKGWTRVFKPFCKAQSSVCGIILCRTIKLKTKVCTS